MEEVNKYNQQQNTQLQSQFNEDEQSGFNIKDWLMLFLHYWYLFILFAGLAYGLAYLKNRSWVERYRTSGSIIIEESRSAGNNVFMQGFGLQSGYRNIDNQVVMLTSYDLVSRVVDSIPFLNTDYFYINHIQQLHMYLIQNYC